MTTSEVTHVKMQNKKIYMNQIQKFIISTPDLFLTYILQWQTYQPSKKDPFILELKSLITFLLAQKNTPHDISKFRSVL
jgi:hypothetical protein